MRRRESLAAVEPPPHLAEFDPAAWGWNGPQHEDGQTCAGYRRAHGRYLAEWTAWLVEHPGFDWFADIARRHPDEPWPST